MHKKIITRKMSSETDQLRVLDDSLPAKEC